MGREVKRVPLDFKWPIRQIWKGYWHPFSSLKCQVCDGSGENPEFKKLSDDWYAFDRPGRKWCYSITQDEVQALVDEGRLRDFARVPTAEEVNQWAQKGFGHDAINKWICVKQRAKRLGISDAPCEYCNGDGSFYPTKEIAKMSEEWEGFDPPEGEGYQLWETTSEGSPISPVFDMPEKLACWLADNNASTFGSQTATYEQWLKFIRGPGWAPSAVSAGGPLVSGVVGLDH